MKTNRLINATSPYLLQHAHNPVDWYEWGPEALDRAGQEDKPILVSIGYSACHWCHVMERESFESAEIARIMNENFVCIKVDREERPDVDQVYMEAVQAMGTHGGWPLNVFLNPARQPFYGGTYFPPHQWANVLRQISVAFKEKRKDIDGSAFAISEHLNTSDLQRFAKADVVFRKEDLDTMASAIESRFDSKWGGLEKAPKFVMPTIWQFLLRYYSITKREAALHWVTHTLTRMTEAGLYDQLGGGFSRYSVDREWFAPHFEKMLYDNAQLLSLYSEAFAITQNPLFKIVIDKTVGWLENEMTDSSGGFFSALDADSEGVEGKFYTWTWEETEDVLGKRSSFASYFGFTPEGNWEHGRNIMNRGERDILSAPAAEMDAMKKTRDKRIRPGLDDKVLAGWNAMMIIGLTDAFRVLGDKKCISLAESNLQFIEEKLIHDNKLYRSYRKKRSSTEGFLEDYAFLIHGYISLYQCTFNENYLSAASRWSNYVFDNFYDPKEGYFYFTSRGAEPLIARKKEVFDNVIPASNSVMARNLFRLGTLLEKPDWTEVALSMVSQLHSIVTTEPGYTSNWGILVTEIVHGLAEIAIIGPSAEEKRSALALKFLPFALFVGTTGKSDLPLLASRPSHDNRTLIHVCFDKTCQLPVESITDAVEQMEK